MSHLERSPLDWVILGLLAALVVANAAFLLLQRTGGPLIGLAFYLVLLVLTFRPGRPDHRPVMVGGVVGLGAHGVEAAALGWSDYPVLMALNLVLPAGLALAAWVTDRRPQQVPGNK